MVYAQDEDVARTWRRANQISDWERIMTETAAHFIATSLEKVGVKRIYGVVGDSLNGFTDALRERGKIEWVHVRHEETAAFAARADAPLPASPTVRHRR